MYSSSEICYKGVTLSFVIIKIVYSVTGKSF